jgi:P2 family phage contractile tail tube protein
VDGENYIGKVPSVTLPKVTRKTEDYQGGGMLGSVVSIWAWIPGRWMRQ